MTLRSACAHPKGVKGRGCRGFLLDLLFEVGDALFALGERTRRVRRLVDRGEQPLGELVALEITRLEDSVGTLRRVPVSCAKGRGVVEDAVQGFYFGIAEL
jgi:hypothetical protein